MVWVVLIPSLTVLLMWWNTLPSLFSLRRKVCALMPNRCEISSEGGHINTSFWLERSILKNGTAYGLSVTGAIDTEGEYLPTLNTDYGV